MAKKAQHSPLISVLIPVYNAADTLPRCLESVIKQNYQNLEIICINDGSTDSSASVLEDYAEKDLRIKVIHQPNGGLASARNTGLDHAHGVWITAVDPDDYIEPNTYGVCIQSIEKPVELINFGVQVETTDSGEKTQRYFDAINSGITESKILPATSAHINNLPDSVCNKLMLRELIEQAHLRFPQGLWYEDCCFCHMYYCLCHNISVIPEHLYHYVVHDQSIMGKTRKGDAKLMDRISILEKILTFFENHPSGKARDEIVYELITSLDSVVREIQPKYKQEARHKVQQFIRRWKLQERFAQDPLISELMQPPWLNTLTRLFYHRKRSRTTWKFFGIPLVSLNRTIGKRRWRVLGIPCGPTT